MTGITKRMVWLWVAAALRAGMMAFRLNHRERVIPAMTDHWKLKAGWSTLELQPSRRFISSNTSGYFDRAIISLVTAQQPLVFTFAAVCFVR